MLSPQQNYKIWMNQPQLKQELNSLKDVNFGNMNFLAHLYLAGNDTDSIIGNFIADHVKGKNINLYSPGIRQGIRFHRLIDEFTDKNHIVKYTLLNLHPEFHKYAGVVLDMYYDHFLANQWSKWSQESLEDFSVRMYSILLGSIELLPQRSQYLLPFMMEGNWLLNYKNFEGLHNALSGMSQRTKFVSNLNNAVDHLKKNYNFYSNSFNEFFPEIYKFSKIENYEY